ncbi:MAG: beta-ketoacyl synthase N-terminal-like domain-containing protein, partial [Myroides sp.]
NPLKNDSVLILSTTKGNIDALANNDLNGAFIDQLAKNINSYFGFKTDSIVVSKACTSGVVALSVAKRFIEMEQFTNAYVVAVDELTPFVVSGFQSFQAMSSEPCKPYDADRSGVNLGEAAVAVFVSNENRTESIQILGDANINDANHISGPSRTGEGLFLSIEKALNEAQIASNQIDYISAHGTATLFNDEMEAVAFNRLNLQNVPTNSLKGYFGHTLGASGLLETVITIESLKNNVLIPSFGYQQQGTTQQINIITKKESKALKTALKTASGFGGSNSAMILVKNVDHVRN